ncbi:CPBP family glutamic-type intramembrane protease [Chitinophaga horti]|uniref:CPBP family glutamic-type intramembrane protease n=1 Tax=Chitinophaga horti TaxID=2920382 RepID=UPI003D815317
MICLNKKPAVFVFVWGGVLVLITYACTFLVAVVESWFDLKIDKNGVSEHTWLFKLIVFCVIAPLLETYLLQFLPYDYYKRHHKSMAWLILVAGVLFALFHMYSIAYAIVAGIKGMMLTYAYASWQGKHVSRFVVTTMAHAFNNIYFLTLELIMSLF